MSSVRGWLRRLIGSEEDARARAREARDVSRKLHALNRQLAQVRGLLAQQADFTVEALRRVGWQTDADAAQQAALQRALQAAQSGRDVVAGPWTGEVGFELLYWIPFLAWLVEQGLDGRRLIVVSRGGAAPWYRHLTARYVDLLDLMSPEEFRSRTEGGKKQYNRKRGFDQEVVEAVKEREQVPGAVAVHPSAMFRLFAALWRKRSTVDLVDAFSAYHPLAKPEAGETGPVPDGLPPGYVAAKFYFSKAFPDSGANRAFVADLLRSVSRQVPVVLMSTAVRLDEHRDFQAAGGSGLFVVDAHTEPRRNLALQSHLIGRARGFVGTYGGFSYLAPFYGVRSVSFFSRRSGFESHHLEVAYRAFDRLLPGAFLAIDRRAADLVEPAVAGWTRPPAADAEPPESPVPEATEAEEGVVG